MAVVKISVVYYNYVKLVCDCCTDPACLDFVVSHFVTVLSVGGSKCHALAQLKNQNLSGLCLGLVPSL